MYKKLEDLKKEDLEGKKVFLRVDFNVPLTQSSTTNHQSPISEIYRIKAHQETIDFLVSAKARVALVSHIDGSFREIAGDIGKILGHEINFEEDILNPGLESQITLFENIRKYPEEEKNDGQFALSLSKGFDIYVNDAFSVSHREHASVSAVTKFLPSYAGFLVEKEIKNLSKVLNEPAEGKTIVFGGAKISTKLPVIKNFMGPSTHSTNAQGGEQSRTTTLGAGKAEHILIGGALANTIFKFKGIDVGKSVAENYEVEKILKELDLTSPKLFLPKDFIVSKDAAGKEIPEVFPVGDLDREQMILDIGPETMKQFADIIRNSGTAIFNGPLGLAEVELYSVGTKVVLDAMVRSDAFTVVGGGDTLTLVEKLGLLSKFSYVSTGGGAMLEFLAGNKLPGLEALGYYER